jgi:hypothetical protein
MYEVLVLRFLLHNEVHIATFNAIGQNTPLSFIPHILVLLRNHHQAKYTYLKHKYIYAGKD